MIVLLPGTLNGELQHPAISTDYEKEMSLLGTSPTPDSLQSSVDYSTHWHSVALIQLLEDMPQSTAEKWMLYIVYVKHKELCLLALLLSSQSQHLDEEQKAELGCC